jgi:hypothetical protein
MRLSHSNPSTTTVSHDGTAYEADEHGGFDMPDEVARFFLKGFRRFWREADPIPLAAQPAKAKVEVEQETTPEQETEPDPTPPPVKAKPGPKPKPKAVVSDGAKQAE